MDLIFLQKLCGKVEKYKSVSTKFNMIGGMNIEGTNGK